MLLSLQLQEERCEPQLSEETALVSGCTAGIGLAIATPPAQKGATVIVNGRTEERVNVAIV